MLDQAVLLSIRWWFGEFFAALPALLPRWIGSWLLTLVVLIYSFGALKSHVRPRALQIDDRVRLWARSLRWRETTDPAQAAPAVERVWLTWFFRFWTNFASAPSLCVLSLMLPIWFYSTWVQWPVPDRMNLATVPHTIFRMTDWWLLPGLCYTGSMLLSYVAKRIFKRVRPPIESGAFGHRLLRDPSFPSGHSLTSFCFWSMIVVSSLHYGAPPSVVLGLVILSLIIILLTGLSRVYMRVHFPSDVLGGWVIGIVWSCVCYLTFRGVLGAEYWISL
ncbi:MAG TPA: phosphatase PAP2 family protein [Abditibacteriaceae bacterium]|nr:phosphatase PAP2 family protein [Abditibacteriaceae bacterium]